MTTTVSHKTTQTGLRTSIAQETFTETGTTSWVRLSGNISVQLTGTGTAVTAKLERTLDSASADPAPMGANITGNQSTGIAVANYSEAGVAWFRVNVTALTGADVKVLITGSAE